LNILFQEIVPANAELDHHEQSEQREEVLLQEIMWNANLMQQGNFIDIFLA